MLLQVARFRSFYYWVIFHCTYVPLLYPFIHEWTPRLFPYPGYCKPCCNEHRGACVFSNWCLFSLDKYPEVRLLGLMATLFLIIWETSVLFLQWLHQSAFAPTVHKGSLFSTSLPALIFWYLFNNSHSCLFACFYCSITVVCIFSPPLHPDNSHSDRCEVVAHCHLRF